MSPSDWVRSCLLLSLKGKFRRYIWFPIEIVKTKSRRAEQVVIAEQNFLGVSAVRKHVTRGVKSFCRRFQEDLYATLLKRRRPPNYCHSLLCSTTEMPPQVSRKQSLRTLPFLFTMNKIRHTRETHLENNNLVLTICSTKGSQALSHLSADTRLVLLGRMAPENLFISEQHDSR